MTWSFKHDSLPVHGDRDGEFVFDATEGQRGVDFFKRRISIPEGDFAGQRYNLPPWQDKWLRGFYGWRIAAPALSAAGQPTLVVEFKRPRRYRRALVGIPRGNLKSMLMCGIALKGLVGDGVPVPRVVGAGTDKPNAAIIYGYSTFSVSRDEELSRRIEAFDGSKILKLRGAREGSYRVIAADDKHAHGGHPTLEVIDDLQAQSKPNLIKVLRTAQITLSDSTFVAAMTAGFEKAGVGWEEWVHCLTLEENPDLDDTYLVAMYYPEAGEDADIEDPAVQRECNPSLGFSIREQELVKAVTDAQGRPALLPEVLTLHFNVWPGSAIASWIGATAWKATAGSVDESGFKHRDCYVGVMATSSADIASIVYMFPPFHPGEKVAYVLDAFVPRRVLASLEKEAKVSFLPFLNGGWLTATEGDMLNEVTIADSVRRRMDQGWKIKQVAWNPRGSVGLANKLVELGLTVVDVTPGFASLSATMRELERQVGNKELAHGGDRLLSWMVGNLRAKRSGMGDLAPDGEASTGNITGAIALLLALSRAVAFTGEQKLQKWGAA